MYHEAGQLTKLTGWGPTTPTTGPSETLNEVDLPIVSNKVCIEDYENSKYHYTVDTNQKICAGYPEGRKDACRGDSGSPLVLFNSYDTDEPPTLIGIVSNGDEVCGSPNMPGVSQIIIIVNYINDLFSYIQGLHTIEIGYYQLSTHQGRSILNYH
jgi:secreted trypsin-like serine protease